MKFIVKEHISHEGKILIAMCDVDLLGKKIEDGDLQLNLSSNFYKGDELSDNDALIIIKNAHILNVVGEKSIEFCEKKGFINKKNVMKIKDVPYAQVLVMRD